MGPTMALMTGLTSSARWRANEQLGRGDLTPADQLSEAGGVQGEVLGQPHRPRVTFSDDRRPEPKVPRLTAQQRPTAARRLRPTRPSGYRLDVGQQPYESAVERAIREAQERGEFDNLPGAGKPLDLRDTDDPDWWIKRYAARENLDLSGALPGALALRKEAAGYPESLSDVSSEANVREIIDDYNKRVLLDRLRPAVGNLPPLLAKTLDVDEMVDRWRDLRARRAQGRVAQAATLPPPPPPPSPPPPARRRWWHRMLGRE